MNCPLEGFHVAPQVHYVSKWTTYAFLNLFSLFSDVKPWRHLTPPFVFSSITNLLSCPLQVLSHLSLPLFFLITLVDQTPLNYNNLFISVLRHMTHRSWLILPKTVQYSYQSRLETFTGYYVSTSARYSMPFRVGPTLAFKFCSNYSLSELVQLNHYLLFFGLTFAFL